MLQDKENGLYAEFLEHIWRLFQDGSLKQISRGQPRNKGHNNQTILIGGFEN